MAYLRVRPPMVAARRKWVKAGLDRTYLFEYPILQKREFAPYRGDAGRVEVRGDEPLVRPAVGQDRAGGIHDQAAADEPPAADFTSTIAGEQIGQVLHRPGP